MNLDLVETKPTSRDPRLSLLQRQLVPVNMLPETETVAMLTHLCILLVRDRSQSVCPYHEKHQPLLLQVLYWPLCSRSILMFDGAFAMLLTTTYQS